MKLLAIDTSSIVGSVALAVDGKLIALSALNLKVTHSERLLPEIDRILNLAKLEISMLDAILISIGPGSFTGIRIGLATAKGLAMAHQTPLIPICTLDMYASSCWGSERDILVALDASMGEIYGALYSPLLEPIIPAQNSLPGDFFDQINKPITAIGNGIDKYVNFLDKLTYTKVLFHQNTANAAALISLFMLKDMKPSYDFDYIAGLEPRYLRKSQAELVKQQKKQC